MNILMILPPLLRDEGDEYSYLTVPPDGYGGVENVVYALTCGLVELGHNVTLVGVPGSRAMFGVKIERTARTVNEIRSWVHENGNQFDIVHDHSNGLVFNKNYMVPSLSYVATHHKTGVSEYPYNTVYLSDDQRDNSGGNDKSSVIRIPVIMDDYLFKEKKDDYFLYLGRVSEWKGVYEAAHLSHLLETKLIIAGPSWESEYMDRIMSKFSSNVEYVGNVSGLRRLELIARAKVLFALSRYTKSPWGGIWHEPGSTVVSEAGASGTPVISSQNGCLSEIVGCENGMVVSENEIEGGEISRIKDFLLNFPPAANVRRHAESQWNHLKITQEYIKVYKDLMLII